MSDLRDQTTGELLLSLKATAWRYSQTRTTRDARILANGAAAVLRELDAAEAERDRLRVAWQSARVGRRSARLLSGELLRRLRYAQNLNRDISSQGQREAEAVIRRVSAHLAAFETGDWGARGTLARIRAEITPTIAALDQPGDQPKETP